MPRWQSSYYHNHHPISGIEERKEILSIRQTDHYWTLDEYYGLEKASDRRYEYWRGEIVCMSGGSKEHGLLISNIFTLLSRARLGEDCFVLSSDQAVKAPVEADYTYPDLSIACAPQYIRHAQGIDLREVYRAVIE
jgi:Uma2 family endonuclease